MISVIIADDHDIVREGIMRVVDDQDDMTVTATCANVKELVDQLGEAVPDVIILDVNMPGNKGPSTVARLVAWEGAPKVVIFTMYAEDSHAVAFLRAGASAFMSKRRSSSELVDAIRAVVKGERFLTDELAEYLDDRGIDPYKLPDELLSEREIEVVRALAKGMRASEYARTQGLSVSTVNTYVHRIKEKLGVRTVVEMVQFAEENDLIG